MTRILSGWLVLVSTLIVSTAGAAVFERDWKTPGDGLLTYDDVNQREWLDLPVSLLSQFPGANTENRYQNALAELAPNGRFFGFTVAHAQDVLALAESSGINTTTNDFNINEMATRQLIDKLGATFESPDGIFRTSVGFLDEMAPPPLRDHRLAAEFVVFFHPSPFARDAGLRLSGGSDSIGSTTTGIMLFRAVPEPSSAWLACFSLVALAAFGGGS